MAGAGKSTSGLEWRINVGDGSLKILVPEAEPIARRIWQGLTGMIAKLVLKFWRFLEKAWNLGKDDPKKVIHCVKVGMALAVVSLFYFLRPLYEGVGGNAMWAVMTVVVVFENNVGATICKSLNRIFGTSLAGFLALGVHWVAIQSGDKIEPLIVGASIFLLASAATFSRFIPSVKARFDYGALIFILTFSLVTVSGYRIEKLFDLAHHRISTIIIGTSLCILVSMLIYPIWAGQQLHDQICKNLDKLASSFESSVAAHYNQNGESDKKLLGYKCVLSAKASEESLANFARWEPAHGDFHFKHPWKQYLRIGAAMRNCAYCIETLSSCIDSEHQAPESLKEHLRKACLKVSTSGSNVIRDMANTIRTMRKSPATGFLVEEMNISLQELQDSLKSLSNSNESGTMISIMHVIPIATLTSLLIDISSRIEAIVAAVDELTKLAEFEASDKQKQEDVADQSVNMETMKTLQRV